MKNFLEHLRRQYLAAPLALLVIIFLIDFGTTFYLKQLWSEGSQWAYHIAQNRSWYIPDPLSFHRQTTVFWQIPAILASLLTDKLPLIVWLFCFGYMIFPYVGLTVAGTASVRRNRPAFFFLLLMVFFLTIMPGSIFSVSVVNEAIMISGLLMAAIILPERPSLILVSICSFWLAFNYELSIALNCLGLYFAWREEKLTRPLAVVMGLAILLQLYFILTFVFPASAQKTFVSALRPHAFLNLHFWNFLGAVAVMILCRWKENWIRVLVPIMGVICTLQVVYIHFVGRLFYWMTSYSLRTWAIPAAGIFLFVGYELYRRSEWQLKKKEAILLTLFFIPITFTQFTVLVDQKSFLHKLQTYIRENPGCKVISHEDYQKLTDLRSHTEWSVHFESVLVQNSFVTEGVLFPEILKNAGGGNRFCHVGRKRMQSVHYDHWTDSYDMNGRFKYPYVLSDESRD